MFQLNDFFKFCLNCISTDDVNAVLKDHPMIRIFQEILWNLIAVDAFAYPACVLIKRISIKMQKKKIFRSNHSHDDVTVLKFQKKTEKYQ